MIFHKGGLFLPSHDEKVHFFCCRFLDLQRRTGGGADACKMKTGADTPSPLFLCGWTTFCRLDPFPTFEIWGYFSSVEEFDCLGFSFIY